MVKSKGKALSNPGKFLNTDVRENTKSQSHDGSLGSSSSVVRKDGEDVGFANGEDATHQKTAESISETSSAKESGKEIAGSKRDFSCCEVISVNKISEASSPNAKVNCLKRENFLSPLGEAKEMGLQPAINVLHRTVSSGIFRLAGSEKEAKSLSPGAEIKGPNKRPAVICDFYAKGWCIKGSSCRFLHVKDHQKKKDLVQQMRDVPTDCKSEVHLEGLRETSQPPVGTKSGVSPNGYSDTTQPREIASNHIPVVPKFLSREESFPPPFMGIGSEVKRQNGFANEYGEHGAVSSNHRFGDLPSCSTSVGEPPRFLNQRPYDYPIPPLKSGSPNVPSTWTGASSLPFSCYSLSASQISSRPDNLAPTKRKISVDDWEPSIPFRPSILLRSLVSLPEIEYDPLRDSIELPKAGDVSLKASFYSQGSSILNTPNTQNNAEAVSENRGLPCNDDTTSVSSHSAHKEKDLRIPEVEAMGASLGSSVVRDFADTTSNSRRRNHGHKDSLGVKVDNFRQQNRMDVGHIMEQTVNKESKALRQFRAALIEFVKESLKPKWLEGRLSKDIHNKIVKKAVEKVLSTLPTEQVPTSVELTNQYLALSRSKIDKLVEGYAEIYGKA